MSSHSVWSPLATNLGLTYYDRFQLRRPLLHAIAGISEGFPVSIAQSNDGRNNFVTYLLRFPAGMDLEPIRARLPEDLRNKTALIDGKLEYNQWYFISLPMSEEISSTFFQLRDALAASVQPPSGICERCNVNTGDFHMVGGYPMQLCSPCISSIQTEQRESTRAYEDLETHPLLGTIFGILAALLGGIAWGLFGYATERLTSLVAIAIGFLVAWSIRRGMGKVTRYGQVLTVILTLAGVFLGDLIMVTLVISKEFQVPISLNMLFEVVQLYPALILERPTDILFSLLFGSIGAIFALVRIQHKPQPVKVI